MFGLPEEVEELRHAANRFAEREVVPNARTAEAEGRWSDQVVEVLRGFDPGDSALARVVLLETIARHDAGGLPAADRPGPVAAAIAAGGGTDVSPGDASALVVVDPETGPPDRLEWAPSWPDLRWIWMVDVDSLTLIEAPTDLGPVAALAFHASGGQGGSLVGVRRVGEWELGAGVGLAVRGWARLWAAAVAVGVAQAAFDATVGYTTERIVFGKAVAHHQGNAFDLAKAAADIHGTRLLVRDAATRFDARDPHAGFWATQAWLETMPATAQITDMGIQLLGGHGFLVDHLAEKRFREARMLTLLFGGKDAAKRDVADAVLDVPDAVLAEEWA